MLRAFTLSVAQLTDPRILRVLVKSLLMTLAIFVAIAVGLSHLLADIDLCTLTDAISDGCTLPGWAQWLATIGGTLALVWLLFPAVAIGVVAGFADQVVAAVEARHYPEAAAVARPLGIGGTLALGLGSSLRLLFWNLVALPFYILLLVTGIGPLILFLGVNALVLGRDLAMMVAARHLDRPARRQWLAQSFGERLLLGGITTALFLVPIVNLVAPVLGAAMATHMFHGRA
jgi:CysZ protein